MSTAEQEPITITRRDFLKFLKGWFSKLWALPFISGILAACAPSEDLLQRYAENPFEALDFGNSPFLPENRQKAIADGVIKAEYLGPTLPDGIPEWARFSISGKNLKRLVPTPKAYAPDKVGEMSAYIKTALVGGGTFNEGKRIEEIVIYARWNPDTKQYEDKAMTGSLMRLSIEQTVLGELRRALKEANSNLVSDFDQLDQFTADGKQPNERMAEVASLMSLLLSAVIDPKMPDEEARKIFDRYLLEQPEGSALGDVAVNQGQSPEQNGEREKESVVKEWMKYRKNIKFLLSELPEAGMSVKMMHDLMFASFGEKAVDPRNPEDDLLLRMYKRGGMAGAMLVPEKTGGEEARWEELREGFVEIPPRPKVYIAKLFDNAGKLATIKFLVKYWDAEENEWRSYSADFNDGDFKYLDEDGEKFLKMIFDGVNEQHITTIEDLTKLFGNDLDLLGGYRGINYKKIHLQEIGPDKLQLLAVPSEKEGQELRLAWGWLVANPAANQEHLFNFKGQMVALLFGGEEDKDHLIQPMGWPTGHISAVPDELMDKGMPPGGELHKFGLLSPFEMLVKILQGVGGDQVFEKYKAFIPTSKKLADLTLNTLLNQLMKGETVPKASSRRVTIATQDVVIKRLRVEDINPFLEWLADKIEKLTKEGSSLGDLAANWGDEAHLEPLLEDNGEPVELHRGEIFPGGHGAIITIQNPETGKLENYVVLFKGDKGEAGGTIQSVLEKIGDIISNNQELIVVPLDSVISLKAEDALSQIERIAGLFGLSALAILSIVAPEAVGGAVTVSGSVVRGAITKLPGLLKLIWKGIRAVASLLDLPDDVGDFGKWSGADSTQV